MSAEGDRLGESRRTTRAISLLSWKIDSGHVDGRDLSGLSAVVVGSYADDEPSSPWRVAIFGDENADATRQKDLADVFLGRIDGDTKQLYGQRIQDVSMVRPAAIELVHAPGRWRIGVETFVEVRSTVEADADGPVTCGLTNHVDGTEMISEVLTVAAPPFEWNFRERCSFESTFAYRGGADRRPTAAAGPQTSSS